MASSRLFLPPRVDVWEDEATEDGVPGFEAFLVDLREGVPDLEDIVQGLGSVEKRIEWHQKLRQEQERVKRLQRLRFPANFVAGFAHRFLIGELKFEVETLDL